MLSFLNPRQQHQPYDEDAYDNNTTPSNISSPISTFIKRGHMLVRKKSTSTTSTASTSYSSSSFGSNHTTESKHQKQRRHYYEGQPRRRVTFSRVVIVNDPTTFLIVKEDHTNPNSLGRRPSKQQINQWLRRSEII